MKLLSRNLKEETISSSGFLLYSARKLVGSVANQIRTPSERVCDMRTRSGPCCATRNARRRRPFAISSAFTSSASHASYSSNRFCANDARREVRENSLRASAIKLLFAVRVREELTNTNATPEAAAEAMATAPLPVLLLPKRILRQY